MRKLLATIVLAVALAGSVGCAKHAAVAPVPGQLNTFDAYAFRVLADAQAAINDFKASVATGKVSETAQLKSFLNQAITDYNAGNAAYQVWHAAGGAGATAPIAAQLAALQGDINNIATQTGGK